MSLVARLSHLFAPPREKLAARRLLRAVMGQARNPEAYLAGGVADTIDGRFDLVVVHLFFVLRRLKRENAAGKKLAQRLFDSAFANFDEALREMGVGDLSIGKKIRNMAEAFYGRLEAYERALTDANPAAFAEALLRNVYRGADPGEGKLAWLAAMLRRFEADVAAVQAEALLAGELTTGRSQAA